MEVCFLLNSDIQWGQQVAAMFQIISTMVVELPSFQEELDPDMTAAYVHELSVDKRRSADSPDTDMASSILPESDWNKRPPGIIPFVSCRPGAYGCLLLAVYERRLTGLLVSSDWLWPVMRGGWRTADPDRGPHSAVVIWWRAADGLVYLHMDGVV